MQEKEEYFGYKLALVFIVISMTLIIFMLPVDTITGAFVFDLTAEQIKGTLINVFYDYYILHAIIMAIIGVLFLGGNLYIEYGKKEARKTLVSLPAKHRLELKNYVSSSLKQGFTEEHIRESLLKEGWDESHVDSILKLF